VPFVRAWKALLSLGVYAGTLYDFRANPYGGNVQEILKMSVFKRGGKGNYYIQFDYRGKTYVKSSRTTNRRIAERMEREWRAEIHAMEEMGQRQRIALRDALKGYLDHREKTGNNRHPDRNVAAVEKKFPTHLNLDEIQDWHLAKFKSQREREGVSPQTIKHNFQAIRNAWKWARDNGYMVRPLEFPKMKIPKHRLRYLSIEEEKRLLAELDPRREIKFYPKYEDRRPEEIQKMQDNYDLVVLLLDTGARYGEIANIQWDRINLEEKTINLWRPKVRNESIIYMTSRVFEILSRRNQSRRSKYVFTNQDGGPRGYSAGGITNAFKRAGLRDFRIHDLRHTCASRLIQNGLSLYEVANVLGHLDIQTTQRYAHLERKDVTQRARDIIEKIGTSSHV
jgi:integrase